MIVSGLEPLAADIDALQLLPGNPRRGDVAAVARSLDAFGQRKPIVALRDGTVIAGNHTLQAAQSLGWDKIAVVWVDDDDATAKAFALADNRTAELGDYDDQALAELIAAVAEADADLLAASGWTSSDLTELLATLEPEQLPTVLTDPDDVPDAPPAKTVPGDVWLLGPHRVVCGDSTDADVVAKATNGRKADMVWTDPPYGMSYAGGRTSKFDMIKNDDLVDSNLQSLISLSLDAAKSHTKKDAGWYVCFTWRTYTDFVVALESVGLEPNACVVWDKGHFGLGHSDYRPQHEFILYVKGKWHAGRDQSDLWKIGRDSASKYVHPTQKPTALVTIAIENSSRHNDLVLDVFGGSGSTLIAAHDIGRIASLVELDPRYVDVICRRFQEHTGILPIAESTGREHDFMES